eukprot:7668644-Pyramimonas_sp.AAC.1
MRTGMVVMLTRRMTSTRTAVTCDAFYRGSSTGHIGLVMPVLGLSWSPAWCFTWALGPLWYHLQAFVDRLE